jgi:23S rRNA pseudouridine1911/1915/1917 synthase
LIAEGAVFVNDEAARAARILSRGDRVRVALAGDAPPRALKPHHRALTIVYEDDAILVIDKPAGLVVHPAPGHWDDTLVNALVARGTQLAEAAGLRPGIVHRLDKDTSGLLLVAKTERAHRKLSRALADRRVRRVYAALVWGHIPESRSIAAAVARHPRDRKRMAVLATGRPARTLVEPGARFDLCDLVRVTLESGRTHQIRVHLAHVGHPVVGDPQYGGGGARRITGGQRPAAEAIERACPRQALHAAELRLVHPESGTPLAFTSEWPADLRAALAFASGDRTLLDRSDPLRYLGLLG